MMAANHPDPTSNTFNQSAQEAPSGVRDAALLVDADGLVDWAKSLAYKPLHYNEHLTL
jgi:hypothetical protein